jgi:hypothetical protein
MRRPHLASPARAGLTAALTLLAGAVAAVPASAGQSSTTMQVTVRVVDRCTVEARATAAGPAVSQDCAMRGRVEVQPPAPGSGGPAAPAAVLREGGGQGVSVVTLVY